MKRLLPLFILMLISISCSKDGGSHKDPNEALLQKNLLGAWSFERVSINDIESLYEHSQNCQKDYFKFSIENNTFNVYEEFKTTNCDDCDGCATIGTVREWELVGENVNFYISRPTASLHYTIISVTENTLRYAYQSDYNNDGSIDQVEITANRYTPN